MTASKVFLAAAILLPALSSAVAEPTLPPYPSLAWTFDEGTGSTAYPAFGTQNGTLKAGTGWSSTNSPFSYAGNHSLDFAANRDYVEFPTHASGATGSFQFWAYASDMDAGDYYVHSLGGAGGRIYIYVPSAGTSVGFGLNGTGGVGSFPRVPNDIWNQFVLVWDESLVTDNVKMYVTNSLGTNIYPFTKTINPGNTGTLFIGGASNNLGFAGQLDDVAFWNAALTPDDVAWLYQRSISEIPEPATATLALLGLAALCLFRRRRRS